MSNGSKQVAAEVMLLAVMLAVAAQVLGMPQFCIHLKRNHCTIHRRQTPASSYQIVRQRHTGL
jgi:hypothetical protein